ncbi:MAG: hypothetical protein JWM11_3344 [Planctomycetaceae bacterium]|nr:hypothetical protein [Planctomycetaceae bacterium]
MSEQNEQPIDRESEAYQTAYCGLIRWLRREYSKPDSPIHTIQRCTPFSVQFEELHNLHDRFWPRYSLQQYFYSHFNQYPPHELPVDFDYDKEEKERQTAPDKTREELKFAEQQLVRSGAHALDRQEDWLTAFQQDIGPCDEESDDPDFNYTAGLYEGASWLFSRFV